MTFHKLYLSACASLIALIFLYLACEARIAPAQPGGTWVMLKCLPLLVTLIETLNGRRYPYQWASMLILIYLIEGIVRVTTDIGLNRWLASGEIPLSLVFFGSSIAFIRTTCHR